MRDARSDAATELPTLATALFRHNLSRRQKNTGNQGKKFDLRDRVRNASDVAARITTTVMRRWSEFEMFNDRKTKTRREIRSFLSFRSNRIGFPRAHEAAATMVAVDGRVAKAVFGLTSYMTEKMRHVKTSEYLLTRCPVGTEARLRGSGACFCGTETMGAQVGRAQCSEGGEMLILRIGRAVSIRGRRSLEWTRSAWRICVASSVNRPVESVRFSALSPELNPKLKDVCCRQNTTTNHLSLGVRSLTSVYRQERRH